MTRRLSDLVALGTAVLVIAGWLCFRFGDTIWWTLPILFGPRWIWLLPLVGLLPLLRTRPRQGAIALALATALVVFGILDFRLGLGRVGIPEHHRQLRVMSINDEGGGEPGQADRLMAEIGRVEPDIVVIPECGTALRAVLARWTHDYVFRPATLTSLCLLTRGTITAWSERDPTDFWKRYGSAAIIRAELTFPDQGVSIRMGLVHLATPRTVLQDYRDLSTIPTLGPATRDEIEERFEESAQAVAWIGQGRALPTVIAGDFNMPIESAVYRTWWSGYRNAFSEVGFGTGYSKHTRLWGIRIDHILTSRDIRPLQSYVGRDVGSDHRPMVADIALP